MTKKRITNEFGDKAWLCHGFAVVRDTAVPYGHWGAWVYAQARKEREGVYSWSLGSQAVRKSSLKDCMTNIDLNASPTY